MQQLHVSSLFQSPLNGTLIFYNAGVGGLEAIVDDLYAKFMKEGVKASIYVVCGRNEKLRANLANKDWAKILAGEHKSKRRSILGRLSRKSKGKEHAESTENGVESATGDVKVVGLGFVTQMAEYMVAADVLVSKAGPGTHLESYRGRYFEAILFGCSLPSFCL
jgi:1,2-diacylglycerol 3-beta-galactosyltransferase